MILENYLIEIYSHFRVFEFYSLYMMKHYQINKDGKVQRKHGAINKDDKEIIPLISRFSLNVEVEYTMTNFFTSAQNTIGVLKRHFPKRYKDFITDDEDLICHILNLITKTRNVAQHKIKYFCFQDSIFYIDLSKELTNKQKRSIQYVLDEEINFEKFNIFQILFYISCGILGILKNFFRFIKAENLNCRKLFFNEYIRLGNMIKIFLDGSYKKIDNNSKKEEIEYMNYIDSNSLNCITEIQYLLFLFYYAFSLPLDLFGFIENHGIERKYEINEEEHPLNSFDNIEIINFVMINYFDYSNLLMEKIRKLTGFEDFSRKEISEAKFDNSESYYKLIKLGRNYTQHGNLPVELIEIGYYINLKNMLEDALEYEKLHPLKEDVIPDSEKLKMIIKHRKEKGEKVPNLIPLSEILPSLSVDITEILAKFWLEFKKSIAEEDLTDNEREIIEHAVSISKMFYDIAKDA